jgi:predicted signal transduction protein with EAL and GGDEF domain
VLNVLRKLFFWNYARNTWQWDVLCVVILIFIFLTPKSWFENSERRAYAAHQNRTASTVLISPELIENTQDKAKVEQVIRTFTGRNDVQVINIRKVVGTDGKTRGYEVDIR